MNSDDTLSHAITTDIELPAGTDADDWQTDEHGTYRICYGNSCAVPGRDDISVQPTAVQLGDGSIDRGAIEAPGVHVSVGGYPLTVAQARSFASAVMAAADEMAALSPDPADPLDGVSMVQLLDGIARKVAAMKAAQR